MRFHPKNTILAFTLTAAGLGVAAPVFAQDAPAAPVERPMGPKGGDLAAKLRPFDANNDGIVTAEEIKAGREAYVGSLDANGDGKISVEELTNARLNGVEVMTEERAKAFVEARDVDGDGLLSAAELATPPMPTRLLKHLDKDGTGIVLSDIKPPHDGKHHRGRDHEKHEKPE